MRLCCSAYGGSWVPVFESSQACAESQTCWPVGVSVSDIYCIISAGGMSGPQVTATCNTEGRFSEPCGCRMEYCNLLDGPMAICTWCLTQVVPRPVLSVLPMRFPVVAIDAAIAPLEADALRLNLHVAHMRESEVSFQDFIVLECTTKQRGCFHP